jgi:hypothetical protein
MAYHQSIPRLLIAATTAALTLGGLNFPALATQVQNTSVKINGGVADFGSGTHSLGSPSGNGSVTFDYTSVNGQIVATARVTGTLYWDALASGCARLIIEFRDLNSNVLNTQRVNTQCPAPGFNANSAANQAPVDNNFANSNLHSVRLRTADVTTGAENITCGATCPTVNAPRTRNFSVLINNGESDFGGGSGHSGGAPTTAGTVSLTRTNGTMDASVIGTLFWDSLNPFASGTARLRIDFQNIGGTTLSSPPPFDLNGSGCCATSANNQLPISSPPFTSGSLWRVRLRVGQVVGGNNVNVVEKIIAYDSTGSFELTPNDVDVAVHEQVLYTFTWTVPEPLNWHDLKSIELRIRDDVETILRLKFDEASNTFRLFNEATGKFGPAFPAGHPNRLQTSQATFYLAGASIIGSDPTGPSVTLQLPLSFKPSAAGHTFNVEVRASDDEGNEPNFEQAGTLTVH